MPKPAVLLLTEGPKVSGPATWQAGLAGALRQNGWDVITHNSKTAGALKSLLQLPKVTAVHAYHVGGLTVPVLVAARLLRLPVVYTVHGDIYKEAKTKSGMHKTFWLPLHRIAFAVSDHLTYPSSYISQTVISRQKKLASKSSVIPNAIDSRAYQSDGRPNGAKLLAITNFNHPQKAAGLKPLAEAVEKLAATYPDIHLTVVGGGHELAAYRRQFASPHITFTGRQDVTDYLKKAAVFVHATFLDNMPYVILEAMAAGLPVVTVPVGGIPEMVAPESLAEPTADGLAAKLDAVLSDNSLRRQIIGQNTDKLRQFEWDTVINGYTKLYTA